MKEIDTVCSVHLWKSYVIRHVLKVLRIQGKKFTPVTLKTSAGSSKWGHLYLASPDFNIDKVMTITRSTTFTVSYFEEKAKNYQSHLRIRPNHRLRKRLHLLTDELNK